MAASTASANGHATNRITGAAQKGEIVTLQAMNKREFSVTIVGTTPLIVHKFSEKARKQMADKGEKKATQARDKRDPQAEYLAAMYVVKGEAGGKGAVYGMPAAGIKNAIVSAARYVDGMNMTFLRGVLHVIADHGGLVSIKHDKSSPWMREDTVRLSGPGRVLQLRYRPEYSEWECTFRVLYNASAITPEQIINLVNVAGFSVGLCEWRPEKNGSNGMFEVKPS